MSSFTAPITYTITRSVEDIYFSLAQPALDEHGEPESALKNVGKRRMPTSAEFTDDNMKQSSLNFAHQDLNQDGWSYRRTAAATHCINWLISAAGHEASGRRGGCRHTPVDGTSAQVGTGSADVRTHVPIWRRQAMFPMIGRGRHTPSDVGNLRRRGSLTQHQRKAEEEGERCDRSREIHDLEEKTKFLKSLKNLQAEKSIRRATRSTSLCENQGRSRPLGRRRVGGWVRERRTECGAGKLNVKLNGGPENKILEREEGPQRIADAEGGLYNERGKDGRRNMEGEPRSSEVMTSTNAGGARMGDREECAGGATLQRVMTCTNARGAREYTEE
ncbi:hypothetical protein B0H16DRAFT_1477350 [Mycena metata]|uniref:Uncharacterized protein n=1 Tax=Mycena metata TaxID=1033252 RepID=A0AAD7H9S7_9AGAR|nr:hypothetical protein B0H16DRAFT_1477350 [Mycena metata]